MKLFYYLTCFTALSIGALFADDETPAHPAKKFQQQQKAIQSVIYYNSWDIGKIEKTYRTGEIERTNLILLVRAEYPKSAKNGAACPFVTLITQNKSSRVPSLIEESATGYIIPSEIPTILENLDVLEKAPLDASTQSASFESLYDLHFSTRLDEKGVKGYYIYYPVKNAYTFLTPENLAQFRTLLTKAKAHLDAQSVEIKPEPVTTP